MKYPRRNKLETVSPGPMLQAALSPALNRVRRLAWLMWLERGALAGLSLTVIFLVIARLWPWPGVIWWCLAAGGISLLIALILAGLNRPGWYSAALWLDEAGLRERAVTALENLQAETEISRLQRQDTLKQIRYFPVNQQPLPRPWKQIAGLGGLAMLVLALSLLPNPRQIEAEREQAVRRAAAEQSHQVAAVRKKIEAANQANPLPEREQTIQTMKELERQLAQTRNLNQGLQAVAQAEDRLQKLQDSAGVNDSSQSLAQALQRQEMTRALGRKMAAGDIKGSQEETRKLLQKAAALSKEQRESAAGELAAEAAGLEPAAAEAMQSLADGIRQASRSNSLLNWIAAAARQNAADGTISQGMT